MDRANKFRVVAELNDIRRVLTIDPSINKNLKDLIKGTFSIDGDFVCVIKSFQAEICNTNEIYEGDEVIVIAKEEVKDQSEENSEASLNQNKKVWTIDNNSFEDLSKQKILEKDLVTVLNIWANPLKFNICRDGGVKFLVKGAKRTVFCSVKGCSFQMNFLAPNKKKADVESIADLEYELESFKPDHNHELNYENKEQFSQKIVEEIDQIKGKFKTTEDIREYINKKFDTNFNYNQISYQVNKLLIKNFGSPNEDANCFINEIKNNIQQFGGHFDYETDQNNQLQKVIYFSSSMLQHSQNFLDMVLIDATYRRNRFNLPLVNICGIDNYGRTIMLSFSLVNNEKATTYQWILKKLKEVWRREPKCVISDECAEIIQGIHLIFLTLKF